MGCARTIVTPANTVAASVSAMVTRVSGTVIIGKSRANSGSSSMRPCMKSPPTRSTYSTCTRAQPALSRTIANRRPLAPRSNHTAHPATTSSGSQSQ